MDKINDIEGCSQLSGQEKNVQRSLVEELSSEIFMSANAFDLGQNKCDNGIKAGSMNTINSKCKSKPIKISQDDTTNITIEYEGQDDRTKSMPKKSISYIFNEEHNTELEPNASEVHTKRIDESIQRERNPKVENTHTNLTTVSNKSRNKQKRRRGRPKRRK